MKKSTAILTSALLLSGIVVFANKPLEVNRGLRTISQTDTQPVSGFSKDTSNLGVGQRLIEYSKVPANIQYAVREQYPNFEPNKMATEFVASGQTIYYVTVENDSRIIALRCDTDGEILMQSSSRKN